MEEVQWHAAQRHPVAWLQVHVLSVVSCAMNGGQRQQKEHGGGGGGWGGGWRVEEGASGVE